MNEVTPSSKNSVLKTLAVVGFVAVLILSVWLAVKIVQVIPGAFASLASIADGVYNNRPAETLVVSANESILNSNESFTLNWTDMNQAGSYSFKYTCTDGVAIDVRNQAGAIIAVDCDTPVNLGSDVTTLAVQAASAKRRFTDVDYTITFTPENASNAPMTANNRFTVVNSSIPQSAELAEATDEAAEPVVEEDTTPVVTTPRPPVATAPVVTETPIFAIPVSDPTGFTDLEVTFLGVGTMDRNNRFTRAATIDRDSRGAFQFAVKNIGTKTSGTWEYEARLTSDGTYESPAQSPLKPNERAVITLGFDAVGAAGFQDFGVTVSGGNDRTSRNNTFTWAVTVTN